MNEVFADTSGWASFFLEDDLHHAKAYSLIEQWKQQSRQVITTNYVLSELIVLLSSRGQQRLAVLNYIETIRREDYVEIVHIDETLDEKAWQLLARRLDKKWSRVDAVSFIIIMQERSLTEALTADHHFEQAGFVRLLK